jgi:hypothetical protein
MAQWLQDVSVGEWYDVDGEPFEIVGIDIKAEIVLVQHFDSTLEEFDFDTWVELKARPIPPPEDYSGALDIERADYGIDTEDSPGRSGHSPLDLLDSQFEDRY